MIESAYKFSVKPTDKAVAVILSLTKSVFMFAVISMDIEVRIYSNYRLSMYVPGQAAPCAASGGSSCWRYRRQTSPSEGPLLPSQSANSYTGFIIVMAIKAYK